MALPQDQVTKIENEIQQINLNDIRIAPFDGTESTVPIKDKINQMIGRINAVQDEKKELSDNINKIVSYLSMTNNNTVTIDKSKHPVVENTELETILTEVGVFKTDIKDLKRENLTLTQKNHALSEEIKKLKKNNNNNTSTPPPSSSNNNPNNNKLSQFKQQNDDLKKQNDDLKEQNNDLKQKYNALKIQKDSISALTVLTPDKQTDLMNEVYTSVIWELLAQNLQQQGYTV